MLRDLGSLAARQDFPGEFGLLDECDFVARASFNEAVRGRDG